ncbi:class I SAM-dependent methyltransferase, partial [Desertihabitans aurantiacus]|uniref:class I SAM-dependent methyltransferase n=1 Tax=Desertihabitans aurantiacus TaxID=2282477 RepID=UPI000DF7A34E
MDAALVARLASAEGQVALAVAAEQRDLTSPAALDAVRRRVEPALASAACAQESLRRRAVTKFGDAAAGMLFTAVGLEQASRPEVAAHRAARLAATGVGTVVDLGCGIGSDALALARAGLRVVAVELDPATAAVARANLAGLDAEVVEGDAEALAPDLLDGAGGEIAAFCDPARRDARGRLFDVERFTPSWSLVQRLLAREAPAAVKLGPAVPHAVLPEGCEAEWVTARGSTVEVCLWGGRGSRPDHRVATLLPGGDQLVVPPGGRGGRAPVGEIGAWLHEPVGAVVRAGGIALLAGQLDLHLVDPGVA